MNVKRPLNPLSAANSCSFKYPTILRFCLSFLGIRHEEQILHSKVTEYLDWSPCSVTCGKGHQYRIAPCGYGVADCVPQQEWRTCTLAACKL